MNLEISQSDSEGGYPMSADVPGFPSLLFINVSAERRQARSPIPYHRPLARCFTLALGGFVALAVTCCVGVATAATYELPHIVDRQATPLPVDGISRYAQKVQDGFSSLFEAIARTGDRSGDSTTPPTPTPTPITAAGLNWCRWWSFQDMANEVTGYPWLNIYATLTSDLSRCLAQQFPGNITVGLAANSAAQQNEQQLAQLVAADNPGADPARVPLSIQTWSDWLNRSAQDVPPQS
jgi:hypothetical protein